MSDPNDGARACDLPSLPPAVEHVGRSLSDAGHAAFLVGPSVCDLLSGVRSNHTDDDEADDDCVRVRDALARLPPAQRELIYMRYYDGLSNQQISEVLRLSESAISARLKRLRRKIAAFLERSDRNEVTRHDRQ